MTGNLERYGPCPSCQALNMQHRDQCYKCFKPLPKDFFKPGSHTGKKGTVNFNEPERDGFRVDAEMLVEVKSQDHPHSFAARLRNLSKSGLQVRSETAFRSGSSLTIKFAPESGAPEVTGEVRYSRAMIDESGRTFVTGVKVQSLPKEVIALIPATKSGTVAKAA